MLVAHYVDRDEEPCVAMNCAEVNLLIVLCLLLGEPQLLQGYGPSSLSTVGGAGPRNGRVGNTGELWTPPEPK